MDFVSVAFLRQLWSTSPMICWWRLTLVQHLLFYHSVWLKSCIWYRGSQAHIERVTGVSGTALKCLRSYFTDCSQFISMGGSKAKISFVSTGVLQGLVLGALHFNIYLPSLGHLLTSLSLYYCLYWLYDIYTFKTSWQSWHCFFIRLHNWDQNMAE